LFYDLDLITTKLAKSEVDGGITSLTFCDEYSCPESVTPFFRIKIHDSTFKNGTVDCLFEWVAYEDLSWAYKDDFLLKEIISDEMDFSYGLFFDQHDVFVQSQKSQNLSLKERIFGNQNWGRRERVGRIVFMAAPIMYFGARYNEIIKLDKFNGLNSSKKILINGKSIVRVDLFDISTDPALSREKQKSYWKTMRLNEVIKILRDQSDKEDGIAFVKRRAELAKSFKEKKPGSKQKLSAKLKT
jgi:hypothetical protein